MTEEVEVPKAAKKPAKRKLTKEAKQRIAASQKARWAEKKSAPVAAVPVSAPAAPDPTVLAFRQQLVPLVEKREIIQQHVRQAQRQLQETQMVLQDHQQALQDTENAINYRLNMIAQLTGQPQHANAMHIDFRQSRILAAMFTPQRCKFCISAQPVDTLRSHQSRGSPKPDRQSQHPRRHHVDPGTTESAVRQRLYAKRREQSAHRISR